MAEEIKTNDLIIKAFGASNIGKVRQENQDSFYMNGEYRHKAHEDDSYTMEEPAEEPQLYAVFDGLGGEEGGEVSSRTACEVMQEFQEELIKGNSEDLSEIFSQFASTANQKICKELHSYLYPRGGTTFVAVQISDGVIHPFYLGDSRIYLGFEDSLYLLTEDHTVAMEKVKAGKMEMQEAVMSPENHMLTHFLGDSPGVKEVQVASGPFVKIEPGMNILLCSDGLHDMVKGTDIFHILMNSDNPAEELVQAALNNGGFDNVTPVVVRIEEKNEKDE